LDTIRFSCFRKCLDTGPALTIFPERRHLFSFGSLLSSYSYALVSSCLFSSVVASRRKIQKVVCSLPKRVPAADYCCSFVDNLEKRGGKGKKARKTSESCLK
jgi:hypothetical protein